MYFLTTLEPRQFAPARCSDATQIHAEKDIKKLINEYTRQMNVAAAVLTCFALLMLRLSRLRCPHGNVRTEGVHQHDAHQVGS